MARRPGLGKGLDALIPGNESIEEETTQAFLQGIKQIPIDQIQPNPQQPRVNMDLESLEELAASIREHGILQPLIINEVEENKYTLIAGERRWRAARMAGLTLVPVIERKVTEETQLELALIENLQRTDLKPLEMAEAYKTLSEEFSLTHEQIAEQVGKSRTSVTNTLRLLNLPDQVLNSLAEGLITEGHARALLGLPNSNAQRAVLSSVLNLELSVRQTETLVKKFKGEKPHSIAKPAPPPELQDLENRLRNFFGTKVKINGAKNNGRLVVYYYSEEELNDILDKILPQ